MKKFEYYQFMKWDGGDRHYAKDPVFFNKADADAYIGDNRHDRFDKKTVYIYESVAEYMETEKEVTKQKALAKLTDVEKRALGLF